MVAGCLRILGVNMGNANDGNNEDQDIINARGGINPWLTNNQQQRTAAVARIKAVLSRRIAADTSPWGFKDPHAVLYINDILPLLPSPRVIIVFRDPLAAGQRAQLQSDRSVFGGLEHTLELYSRAARFIEADCCPIQAVSYERALRYRSKFVCELSSFCGVPVTDEQMTKANNFIHPDIGAKRVIDL